MPIRIFPSAAAVMAVILFSFPLASDVRAQSAPLSPELLGDLDFRSIGPAVIGGRIHDVDALPSDPAVIYVATATGGLWKTTNHGVTWDAIFTDQPVSTFGSIEIGPSDPNVIWAGTGEQNNRQSTSWGNGVYRSTDGGESWTYLGLERTRHIGGIVVHPENPDIAYIAALGNLWAGSEARGLYRTTDGGRNWEKVLYVDTLTGVVDVVMDPSDPATLYAATYQRLRRAWGFNGGGPGSGIWKSTDGGDTWTELTGDPARRAARGAPRDQGAESGPRLARFAAAARANGWWLPNGLPRGDLGRIGLAISRTNPDVVMAVIQHADEDEIEGTYRSEDGGETWDRVNGLNPRPMYYSSIYIDPTDEDRVYVLGVEFYRSDDAGRSFVELPTRPSYDVGVHSDHHALWIDPNDPEHFYLAGDGGLYESWDMGLTYARINNFSIAQFYDIGVDMREPYWVYGGTQDNHSWMGPSATRHWLGILNGDWKQIGFGDGVWHAVDPTNARYVYSTRQGGDLVRMDAFTGDRLSIAPEAPPGEDYRFDWNTPGVVSAHDPSTIYLGGNRLLISHDRGSSWERTEDLTKGIDRDTLVLMGVPGSEPMLSRNDGTSSYGSITAIAESPLTPDVLWVGTDDANLQVSRDGGESWTNVIANVREARVARTDYGGVGRGTRADNGHDRGDGARGVRAENGADRAPPVRTLPDRAYVRSIAASAAAPGAAFVAFDLHRRGDFRAYLYKTDDFGESWKPIHGDLPDEGPVNIVIQHPHEPNLLFAGTEHALFVSNDGGGHWTRFPGLPTTLYDDMLIHPRENDLVVGTHGRGILILDDVGPLVEWSPAVAAAPTHLFSVQPARILQYWKDTSYRGQDDFLGENPAFGALISYYLAEQGTGGDRTHSNGRGAAPTATITITNADGKTVREMPVPGTAGVIHRVNWDLRWTAAFPDRGNRNNRRDSDEPPELPISPRPTGPFGPFVSPGTYTITLQVNGATSTQTVRVNGDPEMPVTLAQYRAREAFLLELRGMQRRAREAADRTDSDEMEERLRRIMWGAMRLARTFNGGGVQQATLYPPTETHRRVKRELEAALGQAVAGLSVLEMHGRL